MFESMVPFIMAFLIMAFYISLNLHFTKYTQFKDDQAVIGLAYVILNSTFGCIIYGVNQGINTYVARAYGAKNMD
jgi:hypothetical protein